MPKPAAVTGVPLAAGKSTPAWNTFQRGPKASPTDAWTGRRSGTGERGTGAARAARVDGPATPSARSPGPGLEALQRGDRARPERAVDRAGGKAVRGELELQRGDVPADGARRDRRLP